MQNNIHTRSVAGLIGLVALVLSFHAFGVAEPPRWLTISTLLGSREEEQARDLRFLGRETVIDAVAYSCTLVPENEPKVDKAAILAPRFRRMRELMKGSGIREGILFQATMGHGWTPDSPAAGQKVIGANGMEWYKFCPLDKTFLDYIAAQAKTIGELKPDFFMVDDDTRLITGINGCVCPLHLAEISRRTGRTFATGADLKKALAADPALAAAWDDLLRDSIAGLLRVIRAQIPAEIPGEFCCCAGDAHHAGYLSRILAAPGQKPVVRINNARYLADARRDFPVTLARTALQKADIPSDAILLDEADTCPQVRYSMGATELVHHMVMNSLEGCGGAKIWITRLGNAHETASGLAYRDAFSRLRGYMKAVPALGFVPAGVCIPVPAPDPHRASCGRFTRDWSTTLFGRYGIPCRYGCAASGGVTALLGAQVPSFSDGELRTILSGSVLLDGEAAVALAARGFGKFIGANAVKWQGKAISGERFARETLFGGSFASADLRSHDAKARVVSTLLHRVSGLSEATEELGPGSLYFENELGGRVFTCHAYMPASPHLNGGFAYHNETRKRAIAEALRLLGKGAMPGGVYYPDDAEVLLRAGRAADGREIAVVDNIGIDTLEKFRLVADRVPAEIHRLADDGSWKPVSFIRSGNALTISSRVETFRPAVFALTTPPVAKASAVPYGVCAHVTRSERGKHRLDGTIKAMKTAGMTYVRSDFDAARMVRPDGTFDFSDYDRLLDDLDKGGVTLLPIIYGPRKGVAYVDKEVYRDYVRRIVEHYGRRMPVVEIWNEANLDGFFRGADPVNYAEALKIAYAAVKSVDPGIRVAYTGTAGVPLDWIRKTFEAGAAKCFDIMNVHPYSHPGQPEGSMDAKTEELRKLMAEFGIAGKPIWFTEIGWPTHSLSVSFQHVILAGLKVARPEQKSWNVILADVQAEGKVQDQFQAKELLKILPAGSAVKACSQAETCALLAAGGVDAVVYPFDETFPIDTAAAVNDFITRGGVLVDVGGLPCYFGQRNSERVNGAQHGGALHRFPFGYRAWWSDKIGTYPREAQVFATPRGIAAGVKQEPTGFKSERFLAPDRIGSESEWIPLIAGKTTNGVDLVSAAVVRYHGKRTGAAVLCSLYSKRGRIGTNNEENQARFTARALGIAMAEGVEAFFTYNLRSFEEDPYYSEHHFGLMHADFQPKPAYSAYAQFTRMRPAGSVQAPGEWHDGKRSFFHPQWKRPDGRKAGMLWVIGGEKTVNLRFTGGRPQFLNLYGRKAIPQEVGNGVWRITLTPSPLYFVGAGLDNPSVK